MLKVCDLYTDTLVFDSQFDSDSDFKLWLKN